MDLDEAATRRDDAKARVERFDVAADGSTSNRNQFATVNGVDGMAMDCAGNLYATSGQGIRVFDPSGNELGVISTPKPNNATFGGPDRKTLYIATQTAVYAVDLAVPGLP